MPLTRYLKYKLRKINLLNPPLPQEKNTNNSFFLCSPQNSNLAFPTKKKKKTRTVPCKCPNPEIQKLDLKKEVWKGNSCFKRWRQIIIISYSECTLHLTSIWQEILHILIPFKTCIVRLSCLQREKVLPYH